jgi:lysyl-tRNA synthetase class 2
MTDTWRPNATLQALRSRAQLLQQIRQWFASQNILEVETPQLSQGSTTDPHIESFIATPSNHADSQRYLRTSAEFHMKRLLASGSGDIYELGKVFRVDESGRYHNPEFTMLEWYRVGLTHQQLIDNVEHLLRSLHSGNKGEFPGLTRITYRELWQSVCDIDIAHASTTELKASLKRKGCDVPESIADDIDSLLDLGMSLVICHQLTADCYTCITDYPASQASLARIERHDDFAVACRFEFYYGSLELANGYHELTDATEQRQRFEADNKTRRERGLPAMAVDESLLAAMHAGLPDCAGVAIGVDRLLMILMPEVDHLQQLIAFNWERA